MLGEAGRPVEGGTLEGKLQAVGSNLGLVEAGNKSLERSRLLERLAGSGRDQLAKTAVEPGVDRIHRTLLVRAAPLVLESR